LVALFSEQGYFKQSTSVEVSEDGGRLLAIRLVKKEKQSLIEKSLTC
jgi:hypothetical protein